MKRRSLKVQKGKKRQLPEAATSYATSKPFAKRPTNQIQTNPKVLKAKRWEERTALVTEAKRLMQEAFSERDAAKRSAVIAKCLATVRGHMREIVLKHDASRVIQAILKFGTAAERNSVLDELEEHILDLCRDKVRSIISTQKSLHN